MTRGDTERLADIARAIEAIRAHLAKRTADDIKRDAILYNLVIVGEAVKALGATTKAHRADIPWKQIAGLRDLLAHEYFRIEMAEIRKIVERDLGPLFDAVTELRHDRPSQDAGHSGLRR